VRWGRRTPCGRPWHTARRLTAPPARCRPAGGAGSLWPAPPTDPGARRSRSTRLTYEERLTSWRARSRGSAPTSAATSLKLDPGAALAPRGCGLLGAEARTGKASRCKGRDGQGPALCKPALSGREAPNSSAPLRAGVGPASEAVAAGLEEDGRAGARLAPFVAGGARRVTVRPSLWKDRRAVAGLAGGVLLLEAICRPPDRPVLARGGASEPALKEAAAMARELPSLARARAPWRPPLVRSRREATGPARGAPLRRGRACAPSDGPVGSRVGRRGKRMKLRRRRPPCSVGAVVRGG
jgi:hypothetical protein